MSLTDGPIVFIDTETTSLNPDREAWEIALIHRIPDEDDKERHWFLNIDVHKADPRSLNIGGYWDRHPTGRELSRPYETSPHATIIGDRTMCAVELFRITHKATIVGINPAFDMFIVDGLIRAHIGVPGTWDYHLIDLVSLTRGWIHGRGTSLLQDLPSRSDELAERIGVEPASPADRHTALGDARWCRDWFDHITNREPKPRITQGGYTPHRHITTTPEGTPAP